MGFVCRPFSSYLKFHPYPTCPGGRRKSIHRMGERTADYHPRWCWYAPPTAPLISPPTHSYATLQRTCSHAQISGQTATASDISANGIVTGGTVTDAVRSRPTPP